MTELKVIIKVPGMEDLVYGQSSVLTTKMSSAYFVDTGGGSYMSKFLAWIDKDLKERYGMSYEEYKSGVKRNTILMPGGKLEKMAQEIEK